MERRTNKIKLTGLLLALLLLLSIGSVAASAEELPVTSPSFIAAVEAFSLGNGYAVEPTLVTFKEGENGAQLLDRLLRENGLSHNFGGTLTDQYYLKSIGFENTDKIPQCVLDHIGDYIDEGSGDSLGEQDYTALSGWLLTVNGKPMQVSLNDYYPRQGDVLRVQYSLWYGAEVGLANAMEMDKWMGISDFYSAAEKDELTRQLALVNGNGGAALAGEKLKAAYDEAMTAAQTLDISQKDADRALFQLVLAQNPELKPGDIDNDGELKVADVLAIQKYLALVNVFSVIQRAQADYNGDGAVSVADVLAIQKVIAKA